MERAGRYLRPTRRATVPGVLVTVYVTTSAAPISRNPLATRLTFVHCHTTLSYRRRGKWSYPQLVRHSTPESVIRYIEEVPNDRRIIWVCAPNLTDTLTLIKWWDYGSRNRLVGESVERADYSTGTAVDSSAGGTIEQVAFGPSCGVIAYRHNGRRYKWVDEGNYGFADQRTGETENPSGSDRSIQGAARSEPEAESGSARAGRIAARFTGLTDWWSKNARASFGQTTGQLSMLFLRSWIRPRALCTHSVEVAHKLERASAYGGRASVFYTGDIGATGLPSPSRTNTDFGGSSSSVYDMVYHLDVSAMYAAIMSNSLLPSKLISHRFAPPKDMPTALSERFGVVARVTIRTDKAEYPYRLDGRVIYPIGRFTTVLTGPELLALREHGEVLQCHEMSYYHLSDAIQPVADRLLSLRRFCAENQDHTGSMWVKRLANSLPGKLAQRAGKWARYAAMDDGYSWGERYRMDAKTGSSVRYRYLAGLCWRYDPDASGRGPYTAAFSYIAALGRLQMRRIRELCPAHTVVSQDTDGIWVLPAALAALTTAGQLADNSPGRLRIVDSADSARFLSPRHYCIDGEWILSGFHDPSIDIPTGTITDTYSQPLFYSRPFAAPDAPIHITRTSRIMDRIPGGTIGPDGWIVPHMLPLGRGYREYMSRSA